MMDKTKCPNCCNCVKNLREENDKLKRKLNSIPLTEREIELINGMIEVQKNHAERCKQLQGSVARSQRKKDLERVELLEKIKKEAEKF